jgi:DNA primase
MREWLTHSLLQASSALTEEAEGYLLGRGIPFPLLREMGVGLWEGSEEPCPDPLFTERHGDHGQRNMGWLSFPLWSPRGRVVGVLFRRWDGVKEVSKFHLPEASWVPVFGGMVPSSLYRIWNGADVWLVEGAFDLALAHAVPEKDVVLSCEGAKATQSQLLFLQRFLVPRARVNVVFDMDETGQKMAHGYEHPDTGKRVWGVHERLSRMGLRSRVVRYRGGKDPGEIWEDGGTSWLREVFHL